MSTKTEQRDRTLDQPLGFGRYRKWTWAKIPAGYVQWLSDNSEDWSTSTLARMELERRKERP